MNLKMRLRNITLRTLLLAHLALESIGFLPHVSFPGLLTVITEYAAELKGRMQGKNIAPFLGNYGIRSL